MIIHKKEIETVEGYFAMVLEELQIYSMEVSKFFSVKEIFCQVMKDFLISRYILSIISKSKDLLHIKKTLNTYRINH